MKVTFDLTEAEVAKLDKLAAWRTEQTKGKTQYTPEKCIKGFIESCQTGPSGWMNPSEAASKFEAEKRVKAEAEAAEKKAKKKRKRNKKRKKDKANGAKDSKKDVLPSSAQ